MKTKKINVKLIGSYEDRDTELHVLYYDDDDDYTCGIIELIHESHIFSFSIQHDDISVIDSLIEDLKVLKGLIKKS